MRLTDLYSSRQYSERQLQTITDAYAAVPSGKVDAEALTAEVGPNARGVVPSPSTVRGIASKMRSNAARVGKQWPQDWAEMTPAHFADETLRFFDDEPAEAPKQPALVKSPKASEPAPVREVEIEPELHDYKLIGDTYVFVVDKRIFEIDRDRMEMICADYSEMGGGFSQAELARRHGLPLPILKRIIRAYGHTKAALPFTREAIAEAAENGDLDALAEKAVEVQERALQRKIEAAQLTRMRSRLRELESKEYHLEKALNAAIEAASRIRVEAPRTKRLNLGAPWQAHIISTDEHAGKGSDPRSNYGPGYSTQEMCRRLRAHADYTVAWVRSQPGRCAVLHRSFLGDIYEAFKGTTEHGTELGTDLSDSVIWEMVLDAVIYSVNALRACADRVEVRLVPGNHDGVLVNMLAAVLHRVFTAMGAEDVIIHAHHKRYDAFRVGETLHVLDHGKGYGALTGYKAKVSAEINARETGGELYRGSEFIYTYVGHLHEDQVASLGAHHKLIRLPAFCESNDFETELRLPGGGGAKLFRLNARGRIQDTHELYFSDLPEDSGDRAS